jgi:hypothetical protein
MGLRCSECSAISIYDFKNDYSALDYRQAKTNKIVYNEPVPEPLRQVLKAYIYQNAHKLDNGLLFGKRLSTETIGSFWSKWRRGCAQMFKDNTWLDRYDNKRYRISTHSLRRLHRTILSKELTKKGLNDFYISKLCHYDKFEAYLRYKNEFEVTDNASAHILPVMNPVIGQLSLYARGQTKLTNF